MTGCCACTCFKPHYMVLVDNIFPADPQDGLNKSNMDKLTFFSIKSPEKLDRIGQYLAQKLSRDISRQRIGYVRISMEALDMLLVTCHAPCLNLFVESYLKMVQKLLEQNDPQLQCLATNSFIKFSNIEEDTPSYHRRYDFFVSKFSSMCHSNHATQETRIKLRVAGLNGLQGVVRKTASDDLQVNIWERTHMDKIVPSFLYNMQQGNPEHTAASNGTNAVLDDNCSAQEAEVTFRDLVCRASFGNINAVLEPVLMHLDRHELWVPNDFAVKVFKIIMYSVQAQYGYVVVQMLMGHLDKKSKELPKIKASIVGVLSEAVFIAAGGSIGPSVLEVFHALLRHLRVSVEQEANQSVNTKEEENFQLAIINTIGEFANNLPDFQKIEILMFVMGKMPMPNEVQPVITREVQLQTMLMKTLLKVATKYRTVLLANAMPFALLDPLLKMAVVSDAAIRKIVQDILHTLIDRHDNKRRLRMVRDTSEIDTELLALSLPEDILDKLELDVEKPPRQDVMFMKKNGPLFYRAIYENTQQRNNKVDNFEALYCTLCLICLEVCSLDVYIELIRLALALQSLACSNSMPMTHRCAVHGLVAAFLNLQSQMYPEFQPIRQHVQEVIANRREHAPFFLPEMAFNRNNRAASYPSSSVANSVPTSCMFSLDVLGAHLEALDADAQIIYEPYFPDHRPVAFGLGNEREPNSVDLNKSATELGSISLEIESQASTPTSMRKFPSSEAVTFEALKKVLENNPRAKEEEEERNRQIYESFKSGAFEDIVARSEEKAAKMEQVVQGILNKLDQEETSSNDRQAPPIYEMKFPDLFVY